MLDLAALQAFNHLLAAAPWARAKLAPFAGRRARLVLGPLPLEFRIAPAGTGEVGVTADLVWREVALLHEHGASPMAAIRAATSSGARLLGLFGRDRSVRIV